MKMRQRLSGYRDLYWTAVICLPYIAGAVALASVLGVGPLKAVPSWFDPNVFQFNLVLWLLAILVIPIVTYEYVHTMKPEKARRLRIDLGEEEWIKVESEATGIIEARFKLRNYLPRVMILMLITALGTSLLLFLKPMPSGNPDEGVNYGKGVNFLLAGSHIENSAENAEVLYHRAITGLTAFLFGFLGAYIYFISDLVRSYFILDLTPNTFVFASVRIITASILSLVVSFAFPDAPHHSFSAGGLPVLSFFIGYFPNWGLQSIQKFATNWVAMAKESYGSLAMSELRGMAYAHEVRLEREGFDNVENLSCADPLDLAVRTGFSYKQLANWIDEAWLRKHLRGDFEKFEQCTGLSTRRELTEFIRTWNKRKPGTAIDFLTEKMDEALRSKVQVIATIATDEADYAMRMKAASG